MSYLQNKKESSQNNFKSIINPYELLGIDIKRKDLTMKHVKKAYFEMALLCHPDKGGNESDMKVVQEAYEFIRDQMKNTSVLTDDNINKIENEFKKYCETQEKTIPSFPDIYNNVQEWQKKFNEQFEKDKKNKEKYDEYGYSYCSSPDGYGNEMDISTNIITNNPVHIDYNKIKDDYYKALQYKGENKTLKNYHNINDGYLADLKLKENKPHVDKDFFRRGKPTDDYNSVLQKPLCGFGKEIISFDKKVSVSPYGGSIVSYANNRNLVNNNSDIYCNQKEFNITDYKEAHQEPCLLDLTAFDNKKYEDILKLKEIKMREREEMDKINLELIENGCNIELENDKKNREKMQEYMKQLDQKEEARSYIISNVPSDVDILIDGLIDDNNNYFNDNTTDDNTINNNSINDNMDTDEENSETQPNLLEKIVKLSIEDDFVIIDRTDVIRCVRKN
jgi:curved DNA-binding protein CbpA